MILVFIFSHARTLPATKSMLVNLKTYRLALKAIERAIEAGHVLLRWRQLSINTVATATDLTQIMPFSHNDLQVRLLNL